MVVMKEGVKESSLKRSRQHDLPTPESPINRSLICRGVSMTCRWEQFGNWTATHKEVVVPCSSHGVRVCEGCRVGERM